MYAIEVWVSNQDEVGADADYTESYLDAAGFRPRNGVVLDKGSRLMYGLDANALWLEFCALRRAVSDAGHGVDDAALPPPLLVACLPGSEGAARALQRSESVEATSWEDWCAESLVSRREGG